MEPMIFLALFHTETRRVFRGRRPRKSRFGHMFGGAADYSGLAANKGRPPDHLLLRLNTADPAVGVTLPGAQWLPLLCAIRYAGCDLGYRVLSDGEVKILHQAESKPWRAFPYTNYPKKLPTQPVAFVEESYDPSNVKDALFFAGVFGYGALSDKQYKKLRRHVEKENLPELFGWVDADAYLEEGNGLPFVQGRPVDGCPDPSCENHEQEASLRTFAIFQEERKRSRELWGPSCENLQIIYQICPKCSAIRTSNQCT